MHDLTIEVAIKIGQASEATKQQAMTLTRPQNAKQTSVDALNFKTNHRQNQSNQPDSTIELNWSYRDDHMQAS